MSRRIQQISQGQFEHQIGTFLNTAIAEGWNTPNIACSSCGDAARAYQDLVPPETSTDPSTIATQSYLGATPAMQGRVDEWLDQQQGKVTDQYGPGGKHPQRWDHTANVSNVAGEGLTVVDWTHRQFGPALDAETTWEPGQLVEGVKAMGTLPTNLPRSEETHTGDWTEGWLDEDTYPLVVPHSEYVKNWRQQSAINDLDFAERHL